MRSSALSLASRAHAAFAIAGIALVATGCGAQESTAAEQPEVQDVAPEPVIGGSSLTEADLSGLLTDLPESIVDPILASPARFLADTAAIVTDYGVPVLVDKENSLGSEFAPATLVSLDDLVPQVSVSRANHRLDPETTDALVRMTAAARAEGLDLLVSSAYRSYDYQRDVYARWVNQLGQEQADRVSARPGTSQHQLGSAVDFGCICVELANEPEGIWLAENAYRFGFSMSYPDGYEWLTGYSFEPWHFRYIGEAVAAYEQQWFDGLQQYMLQFLRRHGDRVAEAAG